MESSKWTSAAEAVNHIKSGDNIFIHTGAAAPQMLIKAMMERANELRDINIYHLHTEGEAPYAEPEFEDRFHVNAFFIGSNVRKAIQEGRGSYIPVFLSEVPLLFKRNVIPINVALVMVSPPDDHGFCSLGVSVDTTNTVVLSNSKIVIGQVNSRMPRTHGDGLTHTSHFDFLVEGEEELPEVTPPPLHDIHKKIGKYAAELIEDRACLQMGIGAIPNAVLDALHHHRDLGVHTEMFSDGLLPLIESGVITNKFKAKHNDRIVATFAVGSRKLYDFLDDNPMVRMLDCDYVNSTKVIRENPKTTAINSAIEIDLTGQVCADSIGPRMYSGVGGQMDFIRGASLSEGGKAIIALPSVTGRGQSKIVSSLKPGAGVVTTRAHIQYVVTEWGVANLYGRSMKERARQLINIAHPEHRESLEKEAFEVLRIKC